MGPNMQPLLVTSSLCALLLHLTLEVSAVTYVHWGRSTCDRGASPVYRGFVAGSHYSHPGGGANYLCVHERPRTSSSNVAGFQPHSGRLHGVEYELYAGYANNAPFSYENVGGADLHNQEAVCVVCRQPQRSEVLMIPGRPDCGRADWYLEYSGFLMSDHYGHKRSEHICVDEAPEAKLGGHADVNGGLLFPVQQDCGSLPCPPYVAGNEVTCAVCTI